MYENIPFTIKDKTKLMSNTTSPFSSVQFSCSVASDSLWPHEPQHVRPPCPSPTARVYPNLCPLCQWCHPTTSSSVIPFSSCPQSFPASGSFPTSQLFASGGQSVGVSALTSVLPVNTQDWSLGWTGWIFYVVVILLNVGYWSVQLSLFNCVFLLPLLSVFASCVFSSVI